MVEHCSSQEVDARLGLFYLCTTALVVHLNCNLVLFNLCPELVRQLQCKHEVFSVFDCVRTSLEGLSGLDLYDFILRERVQLSVVRQVDLIVIVFSLLKHQLLLSIVLFISHESLLCRLSPDPDRLVSRHCHEVVTNARDSEAPDLTEEGVEHKDFIESVGIDHLDLMVLARGEHVVSVSDKANGRDAVCMDEHRLVDVTKLHAPDLEVLISTASGQNLSVGADVERQHRQLVAVKVQ